MKNRRKMKQSNTGKHVTRCSSGGSGHTRRRRAITRKKRERYTRSICEDCSQCYTKRADGYVACIRNKVSEPTPESFQEPCGKASSSGTIPTKAVSRTAKVTSLDGCQYTHPPTHTTSIACLNDLRTPYKPLLRILSESTEQRRHFLKRQDKSRGGPVANQHTNAARQPNKTFMLDTSTGVYVGSDRAGSIRGSLVAVLARMHGARGVAYNLVTIPGMLQNTSRKQWCIPRRSGVCGSVKGGAESTNEIQGAWCFVTSSQYSNDQQRTS